MSKVLISVNKITNNEHLNLFALNYDDKSIYYVASRKKSAIDLAAIQDPKTPITADAVIILAECDGRIVFIKQHRPAVGRDVFELPAGLVDEGEDIATAAARELYEETGMKAISVKEIVKPKYSSAGMTDEAVGVVHVICDPSILPSFKSQTVGEQIKAIHLVPKEIAAEYAAKNCDGIRTELIVRAFVR